MNEEEKRKLALSFLAAERQRLSRPASIREHSQSQLDAVVRNAARRNEILSSFEKQGITLDQFNAAYNDAYQRGERDMLNYRFNFFYAATAIAYQEVFPSSPEGVVDFMQKLPGVPEGCENSKPLVQKCLSETGVDTSYADEKEKPVHSTRRDRAAVQRMKRTGITQRDLEIEAQIGYEDGRGQPFHLSSCYAAVAILLSRLHGCGKDEIESFLERIAEIVDEEISVDDIVERAKREAGVDVSQMAKVTGQ